MSQCKRQSLSVLAMLCAAFLFAGCSSDPKVGDARTSQASITEAPRPDGIDPQLWQQLTAELARVVAEQPRSASAAAQGRGSEVRDLVVFPDLGAICNWTGRCQGDYDLNGVVSISDLTPIAVHLGKRSTDPNWK